MLYILAFVALLDDRVGRVILKRQHSLFRLIHDELISGDVVCPGLSSLGWKLADVVCVAAGPVRTRHQG